ncbi:hypothetical protein [Aequorivita antarctica]|uniref:Uncharacterized protein n=1 Tax=Aequorivita antarctica TaxID=153266 RepID=A0A5C6Z0D2_9FLAO|nr:hypothetical protein [Aequorivita antarctica]TXD72793.1 hypothetical protein ESU54_11290 [Aequorivita antarctica]SRX75227.1 hypothetical protein AEQU3_02221 [Aequorivita antarctica]
MEYTLSNIKDTNELTHSLPIKIEKFDFILNINEFIYPVFDKYNIKEFDDDNVICINYWTKVALIDGTSGELLLYIGIENGFVGIESLKDRYLIISDTAMIMINKENFYPIYRAILPDFVLDYELINHNEIKLKFAVDNEIIKKLDNLEKNY